MSVALNVTCNLKVTESVTQLTLRTTQVESFVTENGTNEANTV